MTVKIEIRYKTATKKSTTIIMDLEQESITMGRGEEDLVVRDAKCSRRHALLCEKANGVLVIYDLGSLNGTYVNGKKVLSSEVHKNDIIRIGGTEIKILDFEAVSHGMSSEILPSVNEYLEDEFNSHNLARKAA